MKTTPRTQWLIASLHGLSGQAIVIEDWSKAQHYLLPTVRIIGPQGGEKYRFSALQPELVRFAQDILKWAEGNTGETPGVTAPEGGNDANSDGSA